MPTLDVAKDYLASLLKQEQLDDEQFETLCFDYGVELDKIEIDPKTEKTIFKIDIHPNRPDLLSPEGLALCLNVYQKNTELINYQIKRPEESEKLFFTVEDSVKKVRPFVVAAVLKNVSFDESSFKSFIDYQEKLHCTLSKDRSLSSIGTHDLDKIKGPFTYKAMNPDQISFTALKQTEQMTGSELFQTLEKDLHLGKYLKLIKDHAEWPVIVDSEQNVLSLPPIINGTVSQMSSQTKNILIEVTGTDLTRVVATMRCVVSGFSFYCKDQFNITICDVKGENYSEALKEFQNKSFEIDIEEIQSTIGVEMSVSQARDHLLKMGIPSQIKGSSIVAKVPLNRTDLFHNIDLIEDIAIGHGINSIPYKIPQIVSNGSLQKLTRVTNHLRHQLAQMNMTEALTFSLCSKDDISKSFNEDWQENAQRLAVTIENPKTLEFQVTRTALLPGLLKTLATNQDCKLPIAIYEISDVVYKDQDNTVGALNQRSLAILIADRRTYFENLHGILDKIMSFLNIPFDKQSGYSLSKNDGTYLGKGFIKNMSAQIMHKAQPIGIFGIVSPTVLDNFSVKLPCVALELNIEKLLASLNMI